MKKTIPILALISILFSVSTIAEYKINIYSDVLNKKTRLVESPPPSPEVVPFDETGTYGNIALIGSNGITESSITSNATSESTGSLAGLLDGYQFSSQINSSSAGQIKNGNFRGINGHNTNRYFSVDLGKEASISGFRILSNNPAAYTFAAKNIRIESSVDGTPGSFTTEESFTLQPGSDSGVISMMTPFTSRYFIFHVIDSYNSARIRVGEIEIFQTQL
jgi:hypothetical protein